MASTPPEPFYFRQFYLGCLAQASYLIGSKGEAAVVDPRRDVDIYLEEAKAQGLTIRYVIETHLHADFVSGHLELAERAGATVLISHRAGVRYPHRPVKDGDAIEMGDVTFTILETPGHTPESISIVVTDRSTSPEPRMVLTGDTLFIGDVGRPDLLGSKGLTASHMAGLLYDSLQTKLLPLPDDVFVYPAHGAGSLCGKNLSKDTVSTIGAQKKTNVALQPMSRDAFISFLTAEAPETPRYFPMDVEINREGAESLGSAPPLVALSPAEFKAHRDDGGLVLDVRSTDDYARGSVPQSLNVGLSGQFASWAGTLVDPTRPMLLVAANEAGALEARLRLSRVGLERVAGWLDGGVEAWRAAGFPLEVTPQAGVRDLQTALDASNASGAANVQVVDVRRSGEWSGGHIQGAIHAPLHDLEAHASRLQPDRRTYVICGGGYRSTMGIEILRELGFKNLIDVKGGMAEWKAQGLPTTSA